MTPGTDGGGGEFFGDESQGFAVYSKNITPEGIGNWSDGQLIRAFTAGVNASGEPLFPICRIRVTGVSRSKTWNRSSCTSGR
jgi:hypothetical protein